ncbi:PEP-CTERM protein-sorting domain-containing protein [Nitrosovibrio sp. Nv6]|nr:PEP-CTERM protein-sorting domain-containing protein [Nitrosovibrio sp. Nv6]
MNFISAFGKFCSALASAVVLAGAYPAYASLYLEVDDAGTTAETANYISWDTATISGAIHASDGADVYGFEWAGGFFFANTDGSDFDTMLSLFDYTGNLLAFNDDLGGGAFYSQVSMELDAGNYFLGITYYPNNYHREMRYYREEGIEGSYQIQKTVAMPLPDQPQIIAEVPEPTTMTLLVIGFAGFMLNRRRKRVL